MTSGTSHAEDFHFYIDHAPPREVIAVLRVLSPQVELRPMDVTKILSARYDFVMQKDYNYTPRRLFDLGLARQVHQQGGQVAYLLTPIGLKVQNMLANDLDLVLDVLHYLHYSRYKGDPTDRKYFWSYRRCCEHLWGLGRVIPLRDMAVVIQSEMRAEFPDLGFTSRQGARFDNTAAGRVRAWLRSLKPSPVSEKGDVLKCRKLDRFELTLLALDVIYQTRGYVYGDPVLLHEDLIREVAGVFFLDPECCKKLLQTAARITPFVTVRDTLAGSSISLLGPFTIDNL